MKAITGYLPPRRAPSSSTGWMAGVLEYMSLDHHYQNMLRGVIDSRDILYYLSVTGFFSLLTAHNLAQRPE